MKQILLTVAILLGISVQAAERSAGIKIDNRIKYQHVTGFGGFSPSPQWSYWLGDTEMNKLFGKGETQLGLNIVRLYISPNRNQWAAGVANAKNAKKNGAFIFASPWSPPASWKSNGQTGNGGKLLESHWEDWARYLNDYYLYMKQQGVVIDAVSIQNEPDWSPEYESCSWTGQEMAKFLRLYGHLIECKVIAPEAIHFTRNLHEPILNDAEACANLDILGGHFYGWDGSSYPLAAQKGKEVWMTEFLINERQQNNHINIDWQTDGFLFARSINDAMLANMSAWVHYSLKRYYGCLGDGEYNTVNNEITKRGYVLSHYAKYVSGTTRIRHTLDDASGKLFASAYLSTTGDSVVVMVMNPTADIFNIKFTLPFYTKGGYRAVTAATANAKKVSFTNDESYEPEIKVAAYSVNTFIFEKSKDREDIKGDGDDSGKGTVFADHFDLYGASCIPAGWIAKCDGETRYEGSYSLGPRLMSFSREGAMEYAFYFRSGANGSGIISYGEDASHRLNLEPGKYTLAYSTVGWKANPLINAIIQKVGSASNIKMVPSQPTAFISENGSSVRINNTTDFAIDFEITEADNYTVKWGIAKTSGGYSEALVGNIRLTRHDNTVAITVMGNDNPHLSNKYLDNDRIVITKNGKKYTANGIEMR